MFTDITMFAYTRPVKCNVRIINDSKSPVKYFSLFIIKIPKTDIIIPLWPSYYMPRKPQNIISQNALKNTMNSEI